MIRGGEVGREEGALLTFFPGKGGSLLEGEAYLRWGLKRGFTVCKFVGTKTKEFSSLSGLVWNTNMAALTLYENVL